MRAPVAVAELVADEKVARMRVRDAQQGLGQAHQRHAFRARKRELLHQRFDAKHVRAPAADFGYQPGRKPPHARRCGGVHARFPDQRRHANWLRRPVCRRDGGAPGGFAEGAR